MITTTGIQLPQESQSAESNTKFNDLSNAEKDELRENASADILRGA
jgi:hypothetical protein